MTRATLSITIPEGVAPLPAGYRYGAILTPPGSNGYYIIRERDNRSCVGWMRGECDAVPTAEEIDAAVDDLEVSR